MKNTTKIAAMTAAMFAATALHAPPSHAIAGVLTGNFAMAVAGLAIGTVGGGTILFNTIFTKRKDVDLIGLVLVGIGLVLLDDESGSSVEFKPLTPADAAAIGVSAEDAETYNGDLDQVNAVYRTVLAESFAFNTPDTSAEELARYTASRWDENGKKLSPETNAVLEKVRANIGTKLQAAAQ